MNQAVTKLNVGCGTDIKPGYINMDIMALAGVDVSHDLQRIPYPFADNQFEEIQAIHVLEHLQDTRQVLEEWWRILRHQGRLTIRVPYWNSDDFINDPTHVRPFNEHTLDFFDPARHLCQVRPYYSIARFHIESVDYFITRRRKGYVRVTHPRAKKWLSWAARHLCNVIAVLEWDLRCIKAQGV